MNDINYTKQDELKLYIFHFYKVSQFLYPPHISISFDALTIYFRVNITDSHYREKTKLGVLYIIMCKNLILIVY